MKKKYIYILLLILTAIILFFYISKSQKNKIPHSAENATISNQPVDSKTTTKRLTSENNPISIQPQAKPRLSQAEFIAHNDIKYKLSALEDKLSDKQIEALLIAYIEAYNARLDHEASLAKVGILSSTQFLIEIPAYPDFGKTIKSELEKRWNDTVSSENSASWKNISLFIDAKNEFWGKESQQILINYDPKSEIYHYTHTINPKADSNGRYFKETGGTFEYFAAGKYEKLLHLFPSHKKTQPSSPHSK